MANTIEVVIKQSSQGSSIADVQKQLGGLGSAASGATGFLGKFAGGLGGIATVAGGMIAADLFGRIVSGVSNFVSTGLEAVGSSQQLETSLKALLTANNMYAQTTETVTSAVTKQLMSQEELGIKHDELAAKLATQQATYQEQQERIRQLTAQYGENGLAVIKAKAQHDQLALAMQDTQREMAGLTTTETTYTTATKTAWEQTMSQADAFKIASTQTQDLLDFVSRLAVVSPFETETVELTTKYAIAAGLGVDATKEFVPAFLDLAGAVGITSSELGFAADQLFQVKKVGKLTEIDLRQLRRLGIDLGKVIGVEMGMSIEEFNAKAAESPEIFDELFAAVASFSKNTFAGTAKEMALSVKGLQSTFSDIFVIGARTFLRPLVDAMTPVIAEIAAALSDFVLGGRMEEIGAQAAEFFMAGLSKFNAISSAFGRSWDEGFRMLIYKTAPIFEELWAAVQPILQGWVDNVAAFLVAAWPIVQEKLLTWRDQFFGWVAELYPQIPSVLSGLITDISTFLADNWPTIAAKLTEWSTLFWDWVTTAATNAGTALAQIGAAMMAWATSGEAQASMNGLGQQLGAMLFTALGLAAEGEEGSASVVGSLIAGLTAAVAGAAGALIILGGELVAGIVQGLLEKIGVDLQPATFNELSGILTQIGTDIKTIALYVGEQILTGISEALATGSEQVGTALSDMMTAAIDSFKSYLGIASPSTLFFSMATDMIQGLIDGLLSMGGSLLETLTGLLGTLFGGGGEEGGASLTLFDPAATLLAIQNVQLEFSNLELNILNITSVTIPLLQTMFITLGTVAIAQLQLLKLTGIDPVEAALVLMTVTTLPLLMAAGVATAQTIMTEFTNVLGLMNSIISAINTMAAAFGILGAAARTAGNAIQAGMSKAGDAIGELIDIIKDATEAFEGMANAARDAASAARDAGGASGAAGGLGFAGGTGALGFLVPPGYPNDSFPLRVQSGERVLVAPQGQSIESLVGGRQQVNNYYFNQTVNSLADTSSVINDFQVMRMMLGA